MRRLQVCLIGMFPPPLHGMSLINEYMRHRISAQATPLVIDYSPRNLTRSFVVRFGKIFKVLRCCFQLLGYLIHRRVGAVYLGLSGGNGQVYDALFAGISRSFGCQLYLHHHSYQYLNRHRWVAKLLFSICGKNAIHIVACEKMAQDLKLMYTAIGKVKVISGIAALEPWQSGAIPRKRIRALGFLSNITIEKGILEFLELAEWAKSAGLQLRFLLAGPYQDNAVRLLVEERMSVLDNIIYLGPVYGDKKLQFFDSIDVFLFPTRYVNESEGLVIHEAMSRSVPVIAYSRGCIEQIISASVGARLAPEEDYVLGAVNKINEWLMDPEIFHVVSLAALKQYGEAKVLHAERIQSLCRELINGK